MPGIVPREKIDEILAASDIVSLVEEHVSLKKAGRHLKGCCPFHDEKTPSFMVSPEKQIYHCFGCGEGGNAIGFLMKIDNLPFREALSRLANKAGIKIVFDEREEAARDERDIYYKINRYAGWYFKECLKSPQGSQARDYLKKRGLSEETIANFQLGFAPDSWEALSQFLKAKQVPLIEAEKLGLIRKRSDGSPYDFFRNRVMFPILDNEGRCLGFSGRTLSAKPDEAKYINSPESPIYHKGNTIFGQFQSHRAIRQKGEAIVVEGNVDVIQMHQAGLTHTVAPLGTALTTPQIRGLKRLTNNFTLMLDGDNAGIKAARRALPLFFEAGLHPRLLNLPQGQDPDSFLLQNGPAPLLSMLEQAPKAMDWLFNEELKGGDSQKTTEGARHLSEFLGFFQDRLEKEYYQKKLADILGVNPKSLNLEKRGPASISDKSEERLPSPVNTPKNSKNSLERILLGLYLRAPHRLDLHLGEETFSKFENQTLARLGGLLVRTFREKGGLNIDRIIDDLPNDERILLTELSMDPFLTGPSGDGEDILNNLIDDSLKALKKKQLQGELKQLTREVHLAEMSGDSEKMQSLLQKKSQATHALTNKT